MKQCLGLKIMYLIMKFIKTGVINAFQLEQF